MMEIERGPQDVDKDLVTQLMTAGFKEKAVRLALKAARDDPDAAMATLLVSSRNYSAAITNIMSYDGELAGGTLRGPGGTQQQKS